MQEPFHPCRLPKPKRVRQPAGREPSIKAVVRVLVGSLSLCSQERSWTISSLAEDPRDRLPRLCSRICNVGG